MAQPINSLMNRSKAQLADDVKRLVNQIQILWGIEHKQSDYAEPVQALQQLQREAFERSEAHIGPTGRTDWGAKREESLPKQKKAQAKATSRKLWPNNIDRLVQNELDRNDK